MTIDAVCAPRAEHIPALRALWQEAFGDTDAFLNAFFGTAFSPVRARCVLVENRPVAALYLFDCEAQGKRLAYIYAVATAKEHRGQGLCRALLDDTCLDLANKGYAGAMLVPGDAGLREMYEKMGFHTCSYEERLFCDAEAGEIAICEVDGARYAALRQRLLPPFGVIQERESIAFLQTQAKFFAGEGFVLAARRQGELLLGIELLGDVSAAPHIVHALGCKRGELRTVGESRPLAMYRPLDGGAVPRLYFGLPFDL